MPSLNSNSSFTRQSPRNLNKPFSADLCSSSFTSSNNCRVSARSSNTLSSGILKSITAFRIWRRVASNYDFIWARSDFPAIGLPPKQQSPRVAAKGCPAVIPRRARRCRRRRFLSHEGRSGTSRSQKGPKKSATNPAQHCGCDGPCWSKQRAAYSSTQSSADDASDSRHCDMFFGRYHHLLHVLTLFAPLAA